MTRNSREYIRGSIRAEVVALAILVPVVIIAGALLVRWSGRPAAITAPSVLPEPIVSVESAQPSSDASFTPVTISETTSPEPPATTAAKVVPVGNQIPLVISNPAAQKEFVIDGNDVRTVADVLARAEAEQKITVDTVDYGGSLGLFVEAINGLKNNTDAEMYWHLYVNGARSPVGASNAPVKAGETILWKYEHAHTEDGQ